LETLGDEGEAKRDETWGDWRGWAIFDEEEEKAPHKGAWETM